MNEKWIKLLSLIEPALEYCSFEIETRDGEPFVDLNTMGKSGCQLSFIGDKLVAHTRYKEPQEVNNWKELVEIVYDCVCYRTYFNRNWLDIFKKEGYSDPIGTF